MKKKEIPLWRGDTATTINFIFMVSGCFSGNIRVHSAHILCSFDTTEGRDIVAYIATRYGLDGPRIKFPWRRVYSHPFRPVLEPTQPPVQLETHLNSEENQPVSGDENPPHLAPRLKKEYSCNSTPPLGIRGMF
jgi:hypothetical protein